MAAAAELRHTSRQAFEKRALPSGLAAELSKGVQAEGAWLTVVEDPSQRAAVARLIAEGDRRQFADATWRRELASWMHSRRSGDGLAVSGFARPFTKLVVSLADLGKSTAGKDETLAEETPLLIILGTEGDSPADWLRAGQALERALLIAAGEGVQAGYLNQPCQIADLRQQVRGLLGRDGYPQVVVRLGYSSGAVKPAPRRELEAVLVERE